MEYFCDSSFSKMIDIGSDIFGALYLYFLYCRSQSAFSSSDQYISIVSGDINDFSYLNEHCNKMKKKCLLIFWHFEVGIVKMQVTSHFYKATPSGVGQFVGQIEFVVCLYNLTVN